MGDISSSEVAEVNKVIGTPNGYYFVKGFKDPASIIAWSYIPIAAYWGLGAGIAGYAKFVKGYNILWFIGGFVPLWAWLYYDYFRQPTKTIENAYKYILAKRAATCEFEKNKKRFENSRFAKS